MEFNGTIHKIFDAVQISATFKKRDVVIETSETKDDKTYTELITFQFVQDKCDLLNDKKEGDAVQVLFNLKGRKWISPQGEEKYFNTLDAWQIHSDKSEVLSVNSTDGHVTALIEPTPQAAPNPGASLDDGSPEIPF